MTYHELIRTVLRPNWWDNIRETLYCCRGQTTCMVSSSLWSAPSQMKDDTLPCVSGCDQANYSGRASFHGGCDIGFALTENLLNMRHYKAGLKHVY